MFVNLTQLAAFLTRVCSTFVFFYFYVHKAVGEQHVLTCVTEAMDKTSS